MNIWKDYYQILDVSSDATQEEIKAAYRYKVNIFHPDRLQNLSQRIQEQAEEDLKRINEANDVLKDSKKRAQYHFEWLKRNLKQKESSPEPKSSPKPKPAVNPSSILFKNLEPGEIKRTFFVIKNIGGLCSRIWFSHPNDWLKVIKSYPIEKGGLSLRVEIEVRGYEWGKEYSKDIIIKLDEEEIRLVVKLQMKNKPIEEGDVCVITKFRGDVCYLSSGNILNPCGELYDWVGTYVKILNIKKKFDDGFLSCIVSFPYNEGFRTERKKSFSSVKVQRVDLKNLITKGDVCVITDFYRGFSGYLHSDERYIGKKVKIIEIWRSYENKKGGFWSCKIIPLKNECSSEIGYHKKYFFGVKLQRIG